MTVPLSADGGVTAEVISSSSEICMSESDTVSGSSPWGWKPWTFVLMELWRLAARFCAWFRAWFLVVSVKNILLRASGDRSAQVSQRTLTLQG